MAGTDTLTASHAGSLVSRQPCNTGAHRRNLFDGLFDPRLIDKLSTTAVRASTEFDLNMLIDLIGLVTESASMSRFASGSLGSQDALFFFNAERRSLTVRCMLGHFERFFQLGAALCLDFQLLREPSILGT